MRKLTMGLVLALVVLAHGQYAQAGTVTMQLKDAGPGYSDAGVYVYPYNFSINGSSTEYSLLCDDYFDDITFGESWTANVSTGFSAIIANGQMGSVGPVAALTTRTKAYEDAAWLFQQLLASPAGVNNVAINETIWSLFSDTSAHYATATGAGSWFAQAEANSTAADLNHVTLYTPIDGTQSSGGRPQEFFGPGTVTTQQVAEPSSFAMLAAGLLAFAFVSRKVVRKPVVSEVRS